MDWNAIGAVADLASALAVAVSLVYVAVQVRELRRQSQVQFSMHIMEIADRVRVEVWSNPEVAAFVERCLTADELREPIDRRRFGAHLSQRLWTMNHLHQYRASDEAWRATARSVYAEIFAGSPARQIWNDLRGQFPVDFQREIGALFASLGPPQR